MKKIISVFVAIFMLASLIPAVVLADDAESEYITPGKIIVPYTSGDGITIDGVLAQGEWSETNKIALNETNMVYWVGPPEGDPLGPIDFYYSWGDKGLYMAAVVSDDDIKSGCAEDENQVATRFQIALNPQEMICEDYAGLFFSLIPVDNEETHDQLACRRHNWETQADGSYVVDGTDGYEGKYAYITEGENIIGWTLECVIPWAYIASSDRYGDLDEDETLEDLSSFNPKNEDVTKAYLTATIAYVKCLEHGAQTPLAARTCTDGVVTWDSASYDVFLLLCPPGATERSLDITPFAATVAHSETETQEDPGTSSDVTSTEPDDTTAAPDTSTDSTAAPGTDAPATTTGKASEGDKKSNAGIIIGIVAGVVVVAGAAAGIVLSKKKKK